MKNKRLSRSRLVFIGAGNMAEAIIKAVKTGTVKTEAVKTEDIQILAYDISSDRLNYIQDKYSVFVKRVSENNYNIKEDDVIILAVKPKDAKNVCEKLKQKIATNNIIISIMAGITIKTLESYLSIENNIARIMPNTPAMVGKAMSVVTFNSDFDEDWKKDVLDLFKCLGEVIELSEDKFNAVTALSGSGPAYIFFMAEEMIKAGIEMGLDAAVSKKLVLQTIFGSASMMKQIENEPQQLREKVTSKGGTTETAINFMKDNNVGENLQKAILKAKQKSEELSKQL